MRDILFKNLTSPDKKRKILVSAETLEKSGMRTEITRHFICFIREIALGQNIDRSSPHLYVIKEQNRAQQKQRFFCRIKGNVCAISNNRVFLIEFAHSLKISINALTEKSEL